MRDLFDQAEQVAPAIVVIDELDAIGRARGGGQSLGGHDEREQTLNQVLTEMDGFTGSEGVVVPAATNRPEVPDPALLRRAGSTAGSPSAHPASPAGGRFSRCTPATSPRPGRRPRDGRGQHPGMVGADLADLLDEAALLAARREREQVRPPDLQDALDATVGPVTVLPAPRQETPFDEETASPGTRPLVDEEVRRLVERCSAEAVEVLRGHRVQLDALAARLLEAETEDEDEDEDEDEAYAAAGVPRGPAVGTRAGEEVQHEDPPQIAVPPVPAAGRA
ncbi:AAA family ATPase [Geodermatophilus sp. URMC 62]|uniref:AAA family ATPase n=1 Tax=Geodermatophilus sp. URMC 62 TaxID=3423414 RepID=UPI00406D1DF3